MRVYNLSKYLQDTNRELYDKNSRRAHDFCMNIDMDDLKNEVHTILVDMIKRLTVPVKLLTISVPIKFTDEEYAVDYYHENHPRNDYINSQLSSEFDLSGFGNLDFDITVDHCAFYKTITATVKVTLHKDYI